MSLRLASFASGGGTTMRESFRAAQAGQIPGIEPALVVAQKSGIGAIEKADKLDTPVSHEVLNDTKNPAEILQVLYRYNIDVIFQNGYLPLMPSEIVQIYSQEFMDPKYMETKEGKKLQTFIGTLDGNMREWLLSHAFQRFIFNQHPGCVRLDHHDFGGKGMYGARVTAANILYHLMRGSTGDEIFTESTVQYTHAKLDKGVLLGMKRLNFAGELEEFQSSFSLESIGQRIHIPSVQEEVQRISGKVQELLLPLEHENVIELLQKVGRGEELKICPEYHQPIASSLIDNLALNWAKTQAGILFPKG